MVIAINKTTNKKKILIYNNSILMLDKNDDIIFELNDDILKYNIKFSFNEEGEPYSTNFWKDDEKNIALLIKQLGFVNLCRNNKTYTY